MWWSYWFSLWYALNMLLGFINIANGHAWVAFVISFPAAAVIYHYACKNAREARSYQ